MAHFLLHYLDLIMEEVHKRRAQRHGRSMKEEAGLVTRQVMQSDPYSSTPKRLGQRMIALFANAQLKQPITIGAARK